MKINTLAELKRLEPGTKLRLINSLLGPVPLEKQLRHIHKINSVDMITVPAHDPMVKSYSRLPNATEFEPTENGFKIYVIGGADTTGN